MSTDVDMRKHNSGLDRQLHGGSSYIAHLQDPQLEHQHICLTFTTHEWCGHDKPLAKEGRPAGGGTLAHRQLAVELNSRILWFGQALQQSCPKWRTDELCQPK